MDIFQVSLSVYLSYAKAVGSILSAILLSMFLLAQAASLWSNIWLSDWTDDALLKNSSMANSSEYKSRQNYYLGIYSGLSGAQGVYLL